MVCFFILACALGLLFLLSAGEELPGERSVPGIWIPFYKAGYYLAGKMPKKAEKQEEKQQEAEKLAHVTAVLFLGLGISILAKGAAVGGETLLEGNAILRPQKGKGERVVKLQAQIEGEEETEEMEVRVAERAYTFEEKEALLAKAMEQLDQAVLGENASPDEVRGQVILPTELLEGQVTVAWVQQPDGLLDEQGRVSEDLPQEGTLLQLKAMLTCEEQEAIHEMALRLFPPVRDAAETLSYALKKQVQSAEEDSAQQEKLTLPEEVEGRRVSWMEPEASLSGICLAVTVLASVCAYFGKEQEFRQEKKKRERQLVLDYPNLLFQFSMLLSAGLTMQNTFLRIAGEYREREGKEVRPAYEEMLGACYEMKSGVSEAQAYENFGRRCGITPYVRLGALLSGNLQKGAQGLTGLLRDEAVTAMDERRQLARRLGEEAGTKLLMPMVLMLLIVLVILMLPAVMAF